MGGKRGKGHPNQKMDGSPKLQQVTNEELPQQMRRSKRKARYAGGARLKSCRTRKCSSEAMRKLVVVPLFFLTSNLIAICFNKYSAIGLALFSLLYAYLARRSANKRSRDDERFFHKCRSGYSAYECHAQSIYDQTQQTRNKQARIRETKGGHGGVPKNTGHQPKKWRFGNLRRFLCQ